MLFLDLKFNDDIFLNLFISLLNLIYALFKSKTSWFKFFFYLLYKFTIKIKSQFNDCDHCILFNEQEIILTKCINDTYVLIIIRNGYYAHAPGPGVTGDPGAGAGSWHEPVAKEIDVVKAAVAL